MPRVHKKDPKYTEFCTHTLDGTYAHMNWRANTCMQEQAYVRMNSICTRKNKFAHAIPNLRTQEGTKNVVLQHFPSFLNLNMFLPLLKCQVFI